MSSAHKKMEEAILPHVFFPTFEYCDASIWLLQVSEPFPPMLPLERFDRLSGPVLYLTLLGDQ